MVMEYVKDLLNLNHLHDNNNEHYIAQKVLHETQHIASAVSSDLH